MMFAVYNCIIFLVWMQYQFIWPLSGLELILDRIHAISWHGDSFTKCWPPDGCSRDLDGGETFSIFLVTAARSASCLDCFSSPRLAAAPSGASRDYETVYLLLGWQQMRYTRVWSMHTETCTTGPAHWGPRAPAAGAQCAGPGVQEPSVHESDASVQLVHVVGTRTNGNAKYQDCHRCLWW